MARLRRLVSWVWGFIKRVWAFLREKPWRMLLLMMAAGLGSLAGIPPGNAAYDYSWSDYRFCDDCHIHDYANEAYERSVHFGLTTCHDCHRVPIHHYPINLYLTIFHGKIPQEEMHRPDVQTVVCTQCHSNQVHQEELTGPMPEKDRIRVVKIDNSPLHMTHLRSKTRKPGVYRGGRADDPGIRDFIASDGIGGHHSALPDWAEEVITCMDCHGSDSNRAHSFGATRENCIACHSELKVGTGPRMARISCQECHFWGFAGGPSEPLPEGEHDAPSPHH